MTWQPIAEADRVRAELLDGRVVEMCDLQPGDIFRALAPDGQTHVHPYNHEEDERAYALVVTYPVRATDVAEYGRDIGYAVQVIVAPLKELRRRAKRSLH